MAESLTRWKREEDVVDDITCVVVFLNWEPPAAPPLVDPEPAGTGAAGSSLVHF